MLNHERFGAGKLLICLHGWTMNLELEKADFEPLFSQRSGWERLYVDLPGMGKNAVDPSIQNLDDMLQVLLAALDELTDGRSFALSGTSAGAYLARGILAARPEQVAGLMLRVPKVHPEWLGRDLPAADVLELGQSFAKRPEYVQAFLHKQRTLIQPAEAMSQTNMLDQIRVDPQRYSFREQPQHGVFSRPALIVTGRQDTVTGYKDAWSLLDFFPSATFAVLDQAGHEWPLPERRQQRLFQTLVHDWLDRMEDVE